MQVLHGVFSQVFEPQPLRSRDSANWSRRLLVMWT
jgi:hypothetical protein